MSKLSYWERRQIENMYRYMEKAEDAADQIAKLYLKASRWLSLEADAIFERYMTKHELSEAEARKLLNELQDKTSIDEMIQKLKAGDTKGKKKELIAKLESGAYRARIERLKQLQNQLDYVMKNVYEQEKAISTSHYVDLANEAYYRTIFDIQQRAQAAFSFGYIDSKQIDAVINSKWSGENYSTRIWNNTKTLAQNLKEELLINLVTGRTERETAELIANKFAQGASKARRLVRTESAYLSTELNFKAFEEADVKEYQFMATLDLKTSEICRKMDLKIFKLEDRKIGVNAPPMHPWCRSTVVAIIDRKFLEGKKRAAIDPKTGKTIYVPRDMTYDEWYGKYVKSDKEAELQEGEKGINKKKNAADGSSKVDLEYINSEEYKNKFKNITDSPETNDAIYKRAKAMLTHRNGTYSEDMYLVEKESGRVVGAQTTSSKKNEVQYNASLNDAIKNNKPYSLISIHNHPTNIPPSGADFVSAGSRKYSMGVVACHNGDIYTYKVGNRVFTSRLFDDTVEKYRKQGYNKGIEANVKTLEQFEKDYGIEWRKC